MIAVDTNILVYAHRLEMPLREEAVAVVSALLHSPSPWLLPWPVVHEFIAIVTNGRIFAVPTPLEEAIAQVEALFEAPNTFAAGEGPDYWTYLCANLRSGQVRGSVVHDARIAAICNENGVTELLTADRDFARFGIRVRNPFVPA